MSKIDGYDASWVTVDEMFKPSEAIDELMAKSAAKVKELTEEIVKEEAKNWIQDLEPLKLKKAKDQNPCGEVTIENDGLILGNAEAIATMEEYDAKNPEHKAKSKGLHVVSPSNNVLLIDIDTPEQQSVYDSAMNIFQSQLPGFIIDGVMTTSEHGNKHYYIKINKRLKDIARISLQSVFGSDQKRDALSLCRMVHGDMEPHLFSVLFENDKGIKHLRDAGVIDENNVMCSTMEKFKPNDTAKL